MKANENGSTEIVAERDIDATSPKTGRRKGQRLIDHALRCTQRIAITNPDDDIHPALGAILLMPAAKPRSHPTAEAQARHGVTLGQFEPQCHELPSNHRVRVVFLIGLGVDAGHPGDGYACVGDGDGIGRDSTLCDSVCG